MINPNSNSLSTVNTEKEGGDKFMKMTPSILLNIILIAVLGASFLFTQTAGDNDVPEYDYWADLNDDGIIDILDIVKVTSRYGATGTPINKKSYIISCLIILYHCSIDFTNYVFTIFI
jgi:hypothetical protein